MGGFSGKRHLGDTELWLKISLKYPILKVQTSLIWWRIHDTQEASIESKNPSFLGDRYNLWIEYLNKSPLNTQEKIKAKKVFDKILARKILSLALTKFQFKDAAAIMKIADFKLMGLFSALNISNALSRFFK